MPEATGASLSISDRMRLLDIDGETLATLKAAAGLMQLDADRMTKAFYERVYRVPGLVRLIEEHTTVERLEQTLRDYLLSLTEATFDDAYVAERSRIAAVHDHIDLPIDAYVAQMSTRRCPPAPAATGRSS